jgi:hypothetical protein
MVRRAAALGGEGAVRLFVWAENKRLKVLLADLL